MEVPSLTEERLRSWLDGNQPSRERMCLALLALDRRYSSVKPRRPKGGPDGGRDIEALLDGQHVIYGAVGFRNSAGDSLADKTWVRKKFVSDLKAALGSNPDLRAFVFLTNVDLTPSEQAHLAKKAANLNIESVDIFWRERLRILLDSPDGLGLRYQYLAIRLSDAEQAAFFSRWGSQLEQLIISQFGHVDARLARLEFLQDRQNPVKFVTFVVQLNGNYSPDDLGHFRVFLEIMDMNRESPNYPTLWLGGRDSYPTRHSGVQETKMYGYKNLAWSRNPDLSIQDTVMGALEATTGEIRVIAPNHSGLPFPTLGSFENAFMSVFITEPLLNKVNGIGLIVDEYLLIYMRSEAFVAGQRDPLVSWPESLADTEQEIPWLSILLKPEFQDESGFPPHTGWGLNFSSITPQKLSTPNP